MNRRTRRKEQEHLESVHARLERRLASKRQQLENTEYGSDEKQIILLDIDKIMAQAQIIEQRHDSLGLAGTMKKLTEKLNEPGIGGQPFTIKLEEKYYSKLPL